MSRAAPSPRSFRFTGWHFLAVIVGFFGIVIATDVSFAVLAVKSFPGEVSATPYEDGLAYSQALARREAQARLGWRATAAAEPGIVAVALRDRLDRPLSGLVLTGELQRPATEAGKRTLAFHETTPGRYAAEARGLSGAWDLTAHAAGPGDARFDAERRLTWP